MFSSLFGSSTIPFTADVASVSKSGTKCCTSDPIEDMTPEKFTDYFWKWVEKKPPANSYVTDTKITGEKATGLVEESSFEVSGMASLLVTAKGKFFSKYKVEGDKLLLEQYLSDSKMSTLHEVTTYTMLKDPFRLEVVHENKGARKSGPILKGALESTLKGLGFDVTCEADVDSPGEPGKLSVVSGPLGKEMTTEEFWGKLEPWLIGDQGYEKQGDGSLMKDDGGMLGGSNFVVICFDKAQGMIVRKDFGPDADKKEAFSTSYFRVVKDRVESWANPKASVAFDQGVADQAGKTASQIIEIGSQAGGGGYA